MMPALGQEPEGNEHLLEASEERLRLALEAGRMGTWEWDIPAGRVTWSPNLEALHGREPGTFDGTFESFQADIHPDDRPRVIATIEQAVAERREIYEVVYRVVRADGTHSWLEARGRLFTDAQGEPRHMVGVCTDVTARQESEERLRRTEALLSAEVTRLERAEDALREETRALATVNRIGRALAAELDLERLVQAATDAATEVTGAKFGAFFYNRVDDRGESYMLYTLSGASRKDFSRFPMPRATALFGPTFRGEGLIRIDDVLADSRYGKNPPYAGMPEGHLPVRSYLAAPVVSRTGEVLGGLFFGHPEPGTFTARAEWILSGIASQVAVAIDNANLYKAAQTEIAERRRAEEALKEADQRKDEFLAMLGHELRNPMAPIRNCLELLRQDRLEPEEAEKVRSMMERQVVHLSRLVDDLLDVSRISRGRILLRKELVELGRLVSDTVEDHRGALESHGLTLELTLPPVPVAVIGDPTRLSQALGNLLHNAGKFTDAGGLVAVELAVEPAAGEARLTVRDNGAGIREELLATLFEPFTGTAPDLARSRGGMGLGLALVRRLVDLHGGTVEAVSGGVGQGAEFIVRLPLAAEDAQSEEKSMQAKPEGQPRRILVIEDHADAAESMSLLLEMKGHQVAVAADGPAALKAAQGFQPEVVLCDIGLPGEMDGYAVARRLRADPALRSACLIALTGYGREEDRRRAEEAGFDHHMTKPVDLAALESMLTASGTPPAAG